ncbi:MAG: cysteine desulfurase-like protein [Verrucomicrobia bacterium]|jgi:cysteine desulfurase family protein (TIGR01976 family)|nr:cysteine desulfurase-like protein [Verrucomicrobiota bacterium]
MESFPIAWVREQFPALKLSIDRMPAIFLDGPGGTQVPESVIRAVSDYYRTSNSNLGGQFLTSRNTLAIVQRARAALAEFFNASHAEEIVFGQNMTSLTFCLSRVLAKSWAPASELIVTSLDHDANVSPWRLAAAEKGATVKTWEFRKENCSLDLEDLRRLISDRTVLIAVTLASNAVGSLVDVQSVAKLAKEVGAKLFVDAVHFAPHGKIDVQMLGCDFLACSAYKFFGPHIGVLWARREWLTQTESFKVRPASDEPPGKWETGTQSFESIAGTLAALDYLRNLASRTSATTSLNAAMDSIRRYELGLSEQFLSSIARNRRVKVYGISDPKQVAKRTPTFALRLEGMHPDVAAQKLGERGVLVWSGHFYAVDLIERLGLSEQGGVIRVGFVHYNTVEEVDRTLEALEVL